MGFLDPKPVTANAIAAQAADPESPIGSAVVDATNSALATAGMASTVDIDSDADVESGVVYDDRPRNFVEWTAEGKPSARSQSLMAPAIRAEAGVQEVAVDMREKTTGLSTVDGREVLWFRESDGTLTDHSRRKVNNALLFPKLYTGFWFDSFGYETNTFLAEYIGMPVRAYTEGGQTSQRIAARQGGVRALFTLAGNTVPASGSVSVTSWTANPVLGSINAPRLGYIGGVKGSLAYTSDPGAPTNEYIGTMTFTRIGTGPAVTVSNPVEFVCVEEADTDGYGVIGAFTNDKDLTVPIHHTVANIAAMVERFESKVKRVIVIGSFPSADTLNGTDKRTDFDGRRNAVKDAVRAQWLDPYLDYFMTDQPFIDRGLTATADDIADRNNGLVPRQFRSDGIHLKREFKQLFAREIARAYLRRGWVKSIVDVPLVAAT